jgi:hypothetical protein
LTMQSRVQEMAPQRRSREMDKPTIEATVAHESAWRESTPPARPRHTKPIRVTAGAY